MKTRLKAGFHMIANDRGSQIAKCSAIVCDHMETHFCNRLRSCDRDRRRSQEIEHGSIFCDRLRSFAMYFEFQPTIQRFNKASAGVGQGSFNNEEFIEEVNMSAFTTVTLKISKTKTKRLTAGKKIVEKFNLSAGEA